MERRVFYTWIFDILYISLIFYVYFQVDRQWGIYLTVIGIVILLLGYFPITNHILNYIKYHSLMQLLQNYDIVTEAALPQILDWDGEKIHQKLYELSKIWDTRPMVVFVKKEYIFVNSGVIDQLVKLSQEVLKDKRPDLGKIIALVGQKYEFETRTQIEAVISQLREKELIQ